MRKNIVLLFFIIESPVWANSFEDNYDIDVGATISKLVNITQIKPLSFPRVVLNSKQGEMSVGLDGDLNVSEKKWVVDPNDKVLQTSPAVVLVEGPANLPIKLIMPDDVPLTNSDGEQNISANSFITNTDSDGNFVLDENGKFELILGGTLDFEEGKKHGSYGGVLNIELSY